MTKPASQARQSWSLLFSHTNVEPMSPSAGAGRPFVHMHHLQLSPMHGLLASAMGQPLQNTAHSHHTIKTASLRRWHPTDHVARMAHRLVSRSFDHDVVALECSCALGVMM